LLAVKCYLESPCAHLANAQPLQGFLTYDIALEEWAQEELRSVNGQIEYVLRQAVKKKFRERRLATKDD